MEVCRLVEGQLKPAQLPQLVEVGLEVGEASTLEVPNLQFCLDTLFHHSPFAGAAVVIASCPGDDMRVSYLEIDDDRPTH